LFKKVGKSNISNYRPTAILSSFAKVLEKVMYIQLQEHWNKYRILAEGQFGFRFDFTTNKAIYRLISETLKALNSKFIVGGFFLVLKRLLTV